MARSLAIAALILFCATRAQAAPELATDAERTYGELRTAKDAKSKLMADRWYNLIRLQAWNDLSGKFSTTAKYLEHDPDLAWVKLRVIKGTGADRVVKDLTIPVAKLSKTCQSRVRQISVLREKVTIAAAEVGKEKEEDDAADAMDEGGDQEQQALAEPLAPATDNDGRDERPMREGSPPMETREPAVEMIPASERSPLPALLPPLPSAMAAEPADSAPEEAPPADSIPGQDSSDGAVNEAERR